MIGSLDHVRPMVAVVIGTVLVTVLALLALGGAPSAEAGQGAAPVSVADPVDATRRALVDEQGALRVGGAVGTFPTFSPTLVQGTSGLSQPIGGPFPNNYVVIPFLGNPTGFGEFAAGQDLALTSVTFTNGHPENIYFKAFAVRPCGGFTESITHATSRIGFDYAVPAHSTVHVTYPQPAVIEGDDEHPWCLVWYVTPTPSNPSGPNRISSLVVGFLTE